VDRYSVKFLFQYRVDSIKKPKMRLCEEKIVLFDIKNKNIDIVKKAIKRAKKDEYSYKNDNGDKVFYEFVGIIDICHLGIEVEKDVVWYDIKTMLTPMERKDTILPKLSELKKRITFD